MKRLGFAVLAAALLSACEPRPIPVGVRPATLPGAVHDMSAMAQALGCSVNQVSWSIAEDAQTPGQAGSITPTGLLTAPGCGSPWVGSSIHVIASGCNQTISVAVAVVEELKALSISDAIVFPGTPDACHQVGPNFTVPAGATVQFYAKIAFTCRDAYSPPIPTSWPPTCQ